MKHDPEDLKQIAEEVEGIIKGNRDLLNDEPRILNPLKEAAEVARTKYKDVVGSQVRPLIYW